MKLFIAIYFLTSFAFASNFEHRGVNHFEMIRELNMSNNVKAKTVDTTLIHLDGRVRCANKTHIQSGNCDLELVTNSGKTYEIEENKQLSQRHCKNHKDLITSLAVTKQPSFLFWGGDLRVENYSVQQEAEPIKSIKNQNKRFDHLEQFNVRINI